jgi:hypothetical protein
VLLYIESVAVAAALSSQFCVSSVISVEKGLSLTVP